jgi:antitoxin ParD1/3/4
VNFSHFLDNFCEGEPAIATMTVSLPGPMKEWIEMQVQDGEYASSSDYVRDLIRRDRERRNEARLEDLRRIVDEGLNGGVSTRTTDEIFAEAVAIAKARGTFL